MERLSREQATRVVVKINKDTIQGNIQWRDSSPNNLNLNPDYQLVGKVYLAEYKGRKLRLYKFRAQTFEITLEVHYWSEGIRLELIDNTGVVEWEFDYDNSIENLYETVRFKTSEVSGFFTDVLNEA